MAIIGVGLLGGSVGLALRAAGFEGTLIGAGRRRSSLRKAASAGAVDETTLDPAKAADGADLVIICTPISQFEPILRRVAGSLAPGACVTDVASAKAAVVKLAERTLPAHVRFVGSHPMAGSEQTGVEYARADLFERALCLLTPTRRTPASAVRWVRSFWELLGGRVATITPKRHDELLASVSHLPHAVATALVNAANRGGAIHVAGPGFADTTRIASGDPGMWTDILHTNSRAVIQSIDRLISELERLRSRLEAEDLDALYAWLASGKAIRDQWIRERYKKKALPP